MPRTYGAIPLSFLAALALAARPLAAQTPADSTPIEARYRAVADRLIDGALADSAAWQRLAELTDRFGNRLSGSESLEHALDWILDRMRGDGLERVHAEPAMVPHWVRG